jgi:hypothetical protein
MNTKAKVIISAALLALLTAPASARLDVDDGFNFPRFTKERPHMGQGSQSPSAHLVNRPFQQR